MELIRTATEEEINSIKDTADLLPGTSVLHLGGQLAVIRRPVEADPVFFNNATPQMRLVFMRDICNLLKASGAPAVYFNVPVADEHYRSVLEKHGAVPTSREPELRFKMSLF